MEIIEALWNQLLFEPMLNSLVFLYSIFFNSFGISIVIFTVIIRLITLPLTLRQLRATKAMQTLQPKLEELRRRYSKDRQRLSQESMKLYKEHGVNPLGCLGPMLIQFPIWIGMYQSIWQVLSAAPEGLLSLSQHLYSWLPMVHEAIPLGSKFLWLDLANPDPSPFLLPILVGGSMWVQQKMTMVSTGDPRQSSTNTMMLWMMPVMFGFWTLYFPSGLALYWIVSNLIGIVMQYFITGWGGLTFPFKLPLPVRERVEDAKRGSDSEDSGGGDRARPKATGRRSGRGRGRRSQQREGRNPRTRGRIR